MSRDTLICPPPNFQEDGTVLGQNAKKRRAAVAEAALAVAEACADWIADIGECHFCAYEKSGGKVVRKHGEHCPMIAYLRAKA